MKYVNLSVLMMWIGLVFNILATFSIGFLLQKVYDQTATYLDMLWSICFILLSIVMRYSSNILATKYSYHASVFIKGMLRGRLYQKIVDLGLAYNQRVSTSRITQMASEGIEQIEVYFSLYLPQFFYSMLAPLTLFCVLSFFSLKVALVLLICVPLIPFSIIAVNKIAKKLLKKYWGIYTSLGDHFLDNLQGLTTLKIYQDDAYKNAQMNRDAQHFRKITMKVLTMQLNSVTLMDLIAYGGAAIGIIFGITEFLKGYISLSQAIIFVLLSGEFFIPLRLLGSYFHVAMNGVTATKEIFAILDVPVPTPTYSQGDFSAPRICIKNLDFSYDEDRQILHDINLKINHGAFISFVGESGCGKSTLASLIMRFYQYKNGSILLNNQEIHTIDPVQWVKHVCIVKHKNYLFSGSVYENLLMGNMHAHPSEMDQVLKDVNLYDFLQDNGGLDFMLEEGAKNLSGGQAQRLALARALLHNAAIYIFDEATSNIDIESERIIFDVINKIRKNKSIILISHRLSNVVQSDMIYVMNDGAIIQQGTHQSLITEKGLYQELFESQQQLENLFHQQGGYTHGN
ncbi:MAG: ABC transporter ATP-binding protein/permease [Spirochaetia bacterium]